MSKYSGTDFELIASAQIKQIAGRAGRFRTAAQAEADEGFQLDKSSTSLPTPNLGLVTTLEDAELPLLRKAMQSDAEPIMSAGIFPPTSILMQFAAYFPPSISFSYILLRLHEISLLHPRFHLCHLKDKVAIADVIQPVQNLTLRDRITLCVAPVNPGKQDGMSAVVQAFAACVAENSSGALLDIPQLEIGLLDEEITLEPKYMDRLESLHKSLILYLWLSYRFAGVFINQAMAFYVKSLVEERIDKMLAEFSSSPQIRARIRRMRDKAIRQMQEMKELPSDEEGASLTTEINIEDQPFTPDSVQEQQRTDFPLLSPKSQSPSEQVR